MINRKRKTHKFFTIFVGVASSVILGALTLVLVFTMNTNKYFEPINSDGSLKTAMVNNKDDVIAQPNDIIASSDADVITEEGLIGNSKETISPDFSYESSRILVVTNDGTIETRQVLPGQSVDIAIQEAKSDPEVNVAQPNFIYHPMDFESEDLPNWENSIGNANTKLSAELQVDNSMIETQSDLRTMITPNDPTYSGQWWIPSVKGDEAWDFVRTNKTVSVGVIDTGIRLTHQDLKDNINTQYAYNAADAKKLTKSVGYNGDADTSTTHGTSTAGVVSSRVNNKLGGSGISYNAEIIPVAVFKNIDGTLYSTSEILVRGYQYLLNLKKSGKVKNLRVINMSLGAYSPSPTYYDLAMQKMIQSAESHGILTVAAAGNSNETKTLYPSDFQEVVSVIALNKDDTRANFSDHNKNKNISAPGVSIVSTGGRSDSSYVSASGTSLSAPIVAGSAALMFAYNPSITVAQAKSKLYETATHLGEGTGFNNNFGWGKINIYAAINAFPTNYAPLKTAIDIAEATKRETAMSVDGKKTYSHKRWALPTSFEKLNADISAAKLIYSNKQLSKVNIFNATSKMNADLNIFKNSSKVGMKRAIKAGTYRIYTSLSSKYVLSVAGNSKANGKKIQLDTKGKSKFQRFKVTYNKMDGSYSFKVKASKKRISISGNVAKSSALIVQSKSSNSGSQKWWIVPAGKGKFKLVTTLNKDYGLAIKKAKKNTRATLSKTKSTKSQYFKLKK